MQPKGWFSVFILPLFAVSLSAAEHPIQIHNVRSGTAILHQRGRLTILEIGPRNNATKRIALTHPSDYRQGTDAPYEAHLIAESPSHFLIFTDTFESNPGNIQGHCGASDIGETYIHVVSLESVPHETLSLLIESCLLNIEPKSRSPEWIPKQDSAGFVGRLKLTFEADSPSQPIDYYIAPDGDVTRPQSASGTPPSPYK